MFFKIPDVLSLLFMQFYRRIERLNDIILIYLPKFKALRHRNGICKLCNPRLQHVVDIQSILLLPRVTNPPPN